MLTESPPSLLVELLTNSCIPFTLPLALQTRQFTKRQLRSQEVNAKGVLSTASMPKTKPQTKCLEYRLLTSKMRNRGNKRPYLPHLSQKQPSKQNLICNRQ